MALPSSLYAEDTAARQTLANGTELKWTKKLNQIYGFGSDTDLSITYCEWNSMDLTYARKTPNAWYNACDAGIPDLGVNASGYANDAASGWTRTDGMAPKVDGIFSGVILTSPNSGKYYWGYDPMGSSTVSDGGGQDTRILLDMDINKMLFSVTFSAIVLADLPTGNTAYSADPTSQHFPNTVTITLKDLYNNPDKYGILDYSFGNCLVYGEDTSDHWRIASIKPAFLLYKPDVMAGYLGGNPMGAYNGSIKMSFNPNSATAHPTVSGGGLTAPIYQYGKSDIAYHYCMHAAPEFELKPASSYDLLGQDAILYYWQVYGASTAGNHSVYVSANTIEVGDSIFWGVAEVGVQQTINPLVDKYTQLKWNWKHMYKGRYMLAYMAAFGLYFVNETYDPDTDNITPETLGDSDKIWLGEMSGNGMTTGTWITDLDSYHGPNKDGKTSNPDYKPGGGGDNPDKDDLDNMDTGFASTLSGCTKYFLMSPADVNNLIEDFYTNAFAGSTLSQSIISCYLCGAEPSEFLSTENSKIKIPTVAGQSMFESTRSDYQLINAVLNEIPMGSIDVPRMNGDFHDFSPYTIYEVFLPFCGWCSLPDTVAGRTIVARLEVDIRTMAGKGIIMMADEDGNYATVAEMCANIGASAPFAVIEAGLERQAAVTAGIQTAVGVAQGISGASSGHSSLAISGFGNAIQGVANGMMSSMANYTQVQGKAGDTSDFANGRQPYLKISWAKTDDVVKTTQFAHAFGYVCDAVGTLGTFSGFTVVSNPHIKINATQAEREEIKRLLEEGVVL